MLSSRAHHENEPVANPTAPVEQLWHWLVSGTVHLALGLALGLLAARAMRGRHLRWTWASLALVGALLGRTLLGVGPASTCAVAALCATVRSRRWHREDIDAGMDLALLAAGRSGPRDALRSLVRRIERYVPAQRRGGSSRSGRLLLGYDDKHHAVTVPLGGAGDGTHTLVLGATRSGKTVTMARIATGAIGRGMGVIAVDPKGDGALRRALCERARMVGRPFLEWSPRGPSTYNPYARGSETEIADKALAGERFTEPHYLRQAQRYLGHEIRVLSGVGVEVSLRTLVEYLDPSRLEMLARGLPEGEARQAHGYLDSLTVRQRADLTGVRDRLAILAESDVGDLLDPGTAGVARLDLLAALEARSIVYFGLEADRRPLLAQMLGAAIVQDLQAAVAALQELPVPTLVAIDEFSAIVPERVVGLFARAAAAGVSLVLGTQELADLRLPGLEPMRDQIVGNLSTVVAHRQAVPASAELIASMTEAGGVWRTTRHSSGGLTRTRAVEHAVHAQQITSLGQGRAVVIDLAGGGLARITRVRFPNRD